MIKGEKLFKGKRALKIILLMLLSLSLLTLTPALGARIVGTVYYNNQIVTEYTKAYAEIGLRNVDTNEWLPTNYAYDNENGVFSIENVPPGKYSPTITIQSGYPFKLGDKSASNAGDFVSYLSGLNDDILVPPHLDEVQSDLKVVYSVHLIRPVDNQELRTYAGDPPEKLYQSFYSPSADTFEWEPVPGASKYEVRILLNTGKTGEFSTLVDEFVESTEYSPNLDINSGNDYYSFLVYPYNSDGELIGTFDNYYKNGFGGWFEFQVIPHP